MKLIAVLALGCGLIAAPVMAAAGASASPPCDDANCVPYVVRNVSEGGTCVLATRYVFGLDSSGNTLVCTARNTWAKSAPLIGVRNTSSPCDASRGVAQSPDGLPMTCMRQGWTADFNGIYFPQ